jgi:hypothetical protein
MQAKSSEQYTVIHGKNQLKVMTSTGFYIHYDFTLAYNLLKERDMAKR